MTQNHWFRKHQKLKDWTLVQVIPVVQPKSNGENQVQVIVIELAALVLR